MIIVQRTITTNPEFMKLVSMLDADLAIRDGDDYDFYHQFNSIDQIKHAVVAVRQGQAIGCGAFKIHNEQTVEIKRMFTLPECRGEGVASMVLQELENWAKELGYQICILETGINQPEAIALYTRNNYNRIENYGQYAGIETSVCFEKLIR